MEDYHLRVTGPGISMLTQPSVPTQQNLSFLASSCFAITLREISSYPSAFMPQEMPYFSWTIFFQLGGGGWG